MTFEEWKKRISTPEYKVALERKAKMVYALIHDEETGHAVGIYLDPLDSQGLEDADSVTQ